MRASRCYQEWWMDSSISLRLIVQCFLLSVVFDAYEKMTELSIEDSIKNELSGDFERLMLSVGKNHSKSLLLGHHGKWQVVCLTKGSLLGFSTVQCIRSVPMFFAKRLYKSMKVNVPFSLVPKCVFTDICLNNTALWHTVFFLSDRLLTTPTCFLCHFQGLGTADNTLIRIMISRSEIDMLDIRECFRLRYEKSLYNMIKVGETRRFPSFTED